MSKCCTPENAKLVLRAREDKKTWGTKQVLKCRSCGRRWAQ